MPGIAWNTCSTPSEGPGRQALYLLRVSFYWRWLNCWWPKPASPAREKNHMSHTNMKRNYKQEYNKYYGRGPACNCTPSQRKYRLNKASRARALRKVKNKKNISRNHDVDHSNGNPLDNRSSHLRVIPRSINRGKNKNKIKKCNLTKYVYTQHTKQNNNT